MGWLLDSERPNLHWRVLVELVGRPADSPAARRARGGANAVEPVATLLSELHPDGRWATTTPLWSVYGGPGWRLIAAVKWGADPEDPRLHAASERLLEEAPGEGGLSRRMGDDPDHELTARALEALTVLGWEKHHRVQEWLAWFEATEGWEDDTVSGVAVLAACVGNRRPVLRRRAVEGLGRWLTLDRGGPARLGHPNLLRTDTAEVFSALAASDAKWREEWRPALEGLQRMQGEKGRWRRTSPLPGSLGVVASQPSKWITLASMKAILTYAVEAELPRLFPNPPDPR